MDKMQQMDRDKIMEQAEEMIRMLAGPEMADAQRCYLAGVMSGMQFQGAVQAAKDGRSA